MSDTNTLLPGEGGTLPPEATTPPEATQAPAKAKTVKVRLLQACEHGQCNDVVALPATVAARAVKDGVADDDKAAVAYAQSLPQNRASGD